MSWDTTTGHYKITTENSPLHVREGIRRRLDFVSKAMYLALSEQRIAEFAQKIAPRHSGLPKHIDFDRVAKVYSVVRLLRREGSDRTGHPIGRAMCVRRIHLVVIGRPGL
jgi:hypothetical protein